LKLDQDNFRTKLFQEPFAPIVPRKLDVFHGPDARLPHFSGVPLISTVFDLFSLVSTEFATEAFRGMKRRRYQDIAERAAHIITISESTKRDIVERLGVPADRITCIYPSVSRAYRPRALDECLSIRKKYGINTDYLVCVGNISRRKNIARLLEAFAKLPASLLTMVTLVLAGRESYGGENVRDQIQSLSLGDKVVLTGYVPQEDLPIIVAGARAMVLVSLYEGFGFPVLEAMASGLPVITSNVSSLPEVAGDAALLVDPRDVNAICSTIERIMTDDMLREKLRSKGLARASLFSWDEAAAQTLALYRKVACRSD